MTLQTSQLLLVVVVLGTARVCHTLTGNDGNGGKSYHHGNSDGIGGGGGGGFTGGRYPSYDDDSSQVNMEQMIKVNEGSGESLFEGDIVHDYFVDDHYVSDATNDVSDDEVFGDDEFSEVYNGCNTGNSLKKRAAVRGNERLWKGGVIFYEFDDSISPAKKKVILSSMAHWEKSTCIRFQPRVAERDYLSFYDGSGCFTTVGRAGGRQGVSINDGCMFMGTVAHELAHAMGFWHEQSRPDRDDSVEIVWDNILPGKEHNFNRMDRTAIDSRGVMYDYNSIMHYGAFSFSIDDSKPTIVAKNGSNVVLGQRSKASALDIAQAKRMYCCPGGACASNPCQRGHCSLTRANVEGYTCRCFDGWYGQNCDKNDDRCALLPCGNGVCNNNKRSYMGFKCVCNEGYMGDLCDQEVNECKPNPCKNAAKCVDKLGEFVCECIEGYRGKHCEFLECPVGSFGCINRGVCVKESNKCDFNNDCGDWSDEKDTCGECSFEDGLCGWNNTGDWQWQINGGSTPSDGTGPDLDHTYGTASGRYLFVEASDQYEAGSEAVVTSPVYPASAETCKLQLSYHMYGEDVRELRVEAISNNKTEVLFKKSGPQGNKWKLTIIDIGARTDFSLQLVVVRGDGWKGDIAVDDISLPYCATSQISDPCAVSPCREGDCVPTVGGVRCQCYTGYEGAYCGNNVDECSTNACEHGQCLDHIGYYTCQCYPGYTGQLCQTDVDDCEHDKCGEHGTCLDEVNSFTCSCSKGYAGQLCDQEIEFECSLEDGLCVPWSHADLEFRWKLGRGETPSMGTGPHSDHTTGNIAGKYLYLEGSEPQTEGDRAGITVGPLAQSTEGCSLSFYYSMRGDTIGNLSVALHYWSNSSTLTLWHRTGDQGKDWQYAAVNVGRRTNFSLALIGSIGSYWESDTAIDDIMIAGDCGFTQACKANPCNHGDCHNTGISYVCTCHQGYSGSVCDVDVNECVNNPCGVYGSCNDEVNNFTCSCQRGYTGRYCDKKCSLTCKHGSCALDKWSHNREYCLCDPGYEGAKCDVDVDECQTWPCVNGACLDLVNGYKCACSEGYRGTNCTIENCDMGPCNNGGLCVENADGYTCTCSVPWSGPRCETESNTATLCTPNPCLHGTCSHNSTHYQCQCEQNYVGQLCDQEDPCSQCVNGYCSQATDSECVCSVGFIGPQCDVADGCATLPCQHGGACTSREEHFSCQCTPGYTGDTCQLKSCDMVCEHGGCVRGVCQCDEGFTGPSCNTTAECSTSPCVNGVCNDYTDTFYCNCTDTPYSGAYCHHLRSEFEQCGFSEALCGWEQGAEYHWTRYYGPTPTSNTGPHYDAGLSTMGWYVYLEASGQAPGTYSELTQTVPNNACSLAISYHMWGWDIGTLEVLSGGTSLLKLDGEQGKRWHRAEANVTMYQGLAIQIRGYVGSSYRGDIALDNVLFKPCGYPVWPKPTFTLLHSVNCSFEDSFCGWSNTGTDVDWLRNSGPTVTRNTGPPSTPYGEYYTYVESESAPAQLTSPPFFSGEEQCLTLYVYMFGRAVGDLIITQEDASDTLTTDRLSGSQGARWVEHVVRLVDNKDSVVVLEVKKRQTKSYSWEGDVAVDKISVTKC